MSRTGKWLTNLFILAWIVMLAGIAAVRWEFLPLQAGLLGAAAGAAIAFVYGVILLPVILYKLVFRRPVASGTLWKCGFGLLPAVVLIVTVGPAGFSAPSIHDITTDTDNPPAFVLAAQQRDEGDNSTEYEGEVIAGLQREAYPDIEPLVVEKDGQAVLDVVQRLIRERGWTLLGVRQPGDPEVAGVVEAVATSLVFGFEDDVAIRVTRVGPGRARIDIRSASRVGLGDLGANAARIRELRRDLAGKL